MKKAALKWQTCYSTLMLILTFSKQYVVIAPIGVLHNTTVQYNITRYMLRMSQAMHVASFPGSSLYICTCANEYSIDEFIRCCYSSVLGAGHWIYSSYACLYGRSSRYSDDSIRTRSKFPHQEQCEPCTEVSLDPVFTFPKHLCRRAWQL